MSDKYLGPSRTYSPSLNSLVRRLGLGLRVEPDPAAEARIRRRVERNGPRVEQYVRENRGGLQALIRHKQAIDDIIRGEIERRRRAWESANATAARRATRVAVLEVASDERERQGAEARVAPIAAVRHRAEVVRSRPGAPDPVKVPETPEARGARRSNRGLA